MRPTTIIEHHIKELKLFYDELDMGIILIDTYLNLFFINRWILKRLPEELELIWEKGDALNLKALFNLESTDKVSKIINKAIKDKSITVLSQAFHKWLIPLQDRRFLDGKMRQTCIVQPYKEFKEIALIQIKDESDTVLKSENLKRSREHIKEKNRELKEANLKLEDTNRQLQILNNELLRLNKELKEREKSVKQKSKMEAIGRMAGGITHDFNNYLFIILGNVEFLMCDISVNNSHYSYLQDIQQAANNAKNIIGEISTFRRSDIDEYDYSDGEKEDVSYINIDSVIGAQISLIKAMLPKSININYSCYYSNSPIVRANHSQIQRIFFNLVINAAHAIYGDSINSFECIDHSTVGISNKRAGYIHIIVRPIMIEDKNEIVSIYEAAKQCKDESMLLNGESVVNQYDSIISGKYVAITIHDNGHGIEPENLEKIFDPYFTTKPEGKGSGIGLSVVHGIVKHLKGVIHVRSEVNNGTAFTIFLPDFGEEALLQTFRKMTNS